MTVLFVVLAETIVIEAAVTLIICLIGRFSGTDIRKTLYDNLLCNMFTNPILNLILIFAFRAGAEETSIRIITLIGEISVVAAEYGIYRLVSRRTRRFCLLLSVVTNLASYLIGLIL